MVPVLTIFALCCIMSQHQSISDIGDDCAHSTIITIYLVMIIVKCFISCMVSILITECTFEIV